jgi:hypothetical protein
VREHPAEKRWSQQRAGQCTLYTHVHDAAPHLCGVSTPAGRDDDSVWASRRREAEQALSKLLLIQYDLRSKLVPEIYLLLFVRALILVFEIIDYFVCTLQLSKCHVLIHKL